MNHRLLYLAILACQIFTTFGAIVTVSTFIEVTETLSPGEAPPTTSNPQPEATARSKTEHTTTTQDNPQSHQTDTAPPPAPPSTTAGTTIPSTFLDPILSTTESGISALISVTTTAVPYSTLASSPVESPTSGFSSPSPTAAPSAGSKVNKGAIIGGVSAAGAVLVALIVAAYFWWRRRQRDRDAPATGSRNHNHNKSSVSEPVNTYPRSTLRIKSTFPMFKHPKNSDEASVTSFESRGMKSLFKDSASTKHISISAPIPQPPSRDTIADISKGPYETAFERPSPSSPPPPMPPIPAYIGQPGSRRVSNMSVINEYTSEDSGGRHSNDYNDDNASHYNQGYPMARRSSTLQASRGRGPHQGRRPACQQSRTLHRSQMTAFPGDTDPYTAGMHGAMGNASYVPPTRPAVRGMKDKYRTTAYSASEYTEINLDEDRHMTRLY